MIASDNSTAGPSPLSSVQQARLVPRIITADSLHTVFSLFTMFGPATALLLSALGLTKSQIGVVLAILPFSAITTLLIGPWLSRAGPKLICVIAFLIRKLVLAPILLTPLIAEHFGTAWTFPWIAGIMIVFGVSRAFAEASAYAWGQELLNVRTRGKIVAIDTSIATVFALLASFAASLLMKRIPGLSGYLLLFGVGLIFGLIYVAILITYPGGQPTKQPRQTSGYMDGLILPFRDANFLRYIGASSLMNISIGYGSFMPIFFVERLGMNSSQVFLFDIFQRIGILLCSFFWGWSADRFGSRPIMIFGLTAHGCCTVLYPFLPAHSPWTAPAVYAIAFILTAIWMAYPTGSNRYLFAGAVPSEKRNPYMIVFYAANGCSAALGPLAAGWALDRMGDWNWRFGLFWLTPFSLLTLLGGAIMLFTTFWIRRLTPDAHKGSSDFFSVFTRGSLLMAIESSIRFHYATDETGLITTTERIGNARSAMNQEEVLEALSNPSFNVRYEAVLSITRLPASERLIEALIGIVRRQEPELSMTAAWALGRIGDPRAIPALREAMTSEYGLLRARVARTLGVLKDSESLPLISQGFLQEEHDHLRVAYASALGALHDNTHLDAILALLQRLDDPTLRRETLLAAARMLGGEHHFIRLWRLSESNFQAAAADAMLGMAKRFAKLPPNFKQLAEASVKCAQFWIKEDTSAGLSAFTQCLDLLQAKTGSTPARQALRVCREILDERGHERQECVILALHAMIMTLAAIRAAGRNSPSDK